MSSSILYHNRRQFLRGAGGFALALPILPSLLPRTAHAEATARLPRFIAISTDHGNVWGQNMYPADSVLTEKRELYSGHEIRRGKLAAKQDGGRTSISSVLSATSGLSSTLVPKLNVIRGLDVAFQLVHHWGGFLGNYAALDLGTASSAGKQVAAGEKWATIDQIMAWSPSFYKDLGSIKERSIHAGDGNVAKSMSWGFQNPAAKSGDVLPVPAANSSLELFNRVFVPDAVGGQPSRVPVVDRVLESYKRARQGAFGDANRLSAADKRRLDDHMDRLAELQRRLTVVVSCGDQSPPSFDARSNTPGVGVEDGVSTSWYQSYNDVIVAGMTCGTTRIATMRAVYIYLSSVSSNWHTLVAHEGDSQEAQNRLVQSNQIFFEKVFLDLVNKLDIEEADGKTYLDNTLVMWVQESGPTTHESISLPVVTAGSAAGYFNTGNYVDYRNRKNGELKAFLEGGAVGRKERFPGLLYNQWLANILQAMGVPPSEFERNGARGYGSTFQSGSDELAMTADASKAWPSRVYNDASKPLPFLVG